MTQTVCLRIVYAEIGGILLSHTNTLFRGYKSKLFSLSKKSKSPIVRIPSSFRRGMMWSLKIHLQLNAAPLAVLVLLLFFHHSDVHTIATCDKLIINDVFRDMRLLLLAHIQNSISQTYI